MWFRFPDGRLVEPDGAVVKAERLGGLLNFYLRYMACQQLEIETIPCLVYADMQAYTFNKNVNRLSACQETKMLRKSLETIDEPTIAQTFGMGTIRHRLASALVKKLHPRIAATLQDNKISKICAAEFAAVVPERQVEILGEMQKHGDYSPAFCRSLVLQTPIAQRTKNSQQRKAWAQDADARQDMVSRLEHAEKQHDFYSGLYRQHSTNLMKLLFYVRRIITDPKAEAYLQAHHAEILSRFKEIVFPSEGR
jgi:ParB family transcriptional regulator, chromosome partitioning protein